MDQCCRVDQRVPLAVPVGSLQPAAALHHGSIDRQGPFGELRQNLLLQPGTKEGALGGLTARSAVSGMASPRRGPQLWLRYYNGSPGAGKRPGGPAPEGEPAIRIVIMPGRFSCAQVLPTETSPSDLTA